ncbi:MAG TPA: 4-hydroxyphenylacetate 3-hydroxylase N-terminal domain-containing protein, partial [Nitrososphaerales archaeon]|nr:4-hydroxyphenylacetate 3-hydroxylase N-terminal domain-containing protein [Nitrososphaerales archaeon]
MRTKEQYLSSLADGREIYYRGKRIENIAEHPVLKIAAFHASRLFELQNRSVSDPEFGEISRYFSTPRTSRDLEARHRLIYDTTMACNGVFN